MPMSAAIRDDHNLPFLPLAGRSRFYSCVKDDERLVMQFRLFRKGELLFQRGPEPHWWLTGPLFCAVSVSGFNPVGRHSWSEVRGGESAREREKYRVTSDRKRRSGKNFRADGDSLVGVCAGVAVGRTHGERQEAVGREGR